MTVVGVRTWKELRGIPAFELEPVAPAKQTICTSRSFGEMIEDFDTLMESVANFMASCARKLRAPECSRSLFIPTGSGRIYPSIIIV